MALYTVSSTGNLTFKDTGVTTSVSFFASGSLASAALGSIALSDSGGIVYYTPSRNIIQVDSSGALKFQPFTRRPNSLAASALGEIVLGGEYEELNELTATLANVAGIIQSSGQLNLIGGTSIWNERFNRTGSGQLRLTGSSVQRSLRVESSSGQLKLYPSALTSSRRNELSSGDLKLYTNDSWLIKLSPTSSAQLKLTGQTISIKAYNKDMNSGQLVLSGSTVISVLLQPTSTGDLAFSTYWYDTTHTGGLSTDPLAASAIAAGSESTVGNIKTTQISFYGDNESSGLLSVTPTGEIVRSLSDSSGIAGSSLSGDALAGGQDTERRASTYDIKLGEERFGQLNTTGATSYGYNIDSAGDLLISGSAEAHLVLSGETEPGYLVLSGSSIVVRTLDFLTSGDLTVSSTGEDPLASASSLAASAMSEIPLGGGFDFITGQTRLNQIQNTSSIGYLNLNGSDVPTKTLDFLSSGQLRLAGTTVSKLLIGEPTLGNLKLTGQTVTVRTLDFLSSGQIQFNNIAQTPLGSSGAIAGSALAEVPLSGSINLRTRFRQLQNIDSYGTITLTNATVSEIKIIETSTTGQLRISGSIVARLSRNATSSGSLKLTGSTVQSSTRRKSSSGSLILTNSTTSRIKIIETSATGQLRLTGTTVQSSLRKELTTGQLKLYTSDSYKYILKPTSTGLLKVSKQGENPLGLDSSIAASPLAGLPLGGGFDYLAGSVRYNQIQNINSAGNLIISGSSVPIETLRVLSSGQLRLTASTVSSLLIKESSSGRLKLSGSTGYLKKINNPSSSTLKITPLGTKFRISSIAGSALAELPLAGTLNDGASITKVSYISSGVYFNGFTNLVSSNGNLVLSGTTEYIAVTPGGTVTSTGRLNLTGQTAGSTTLLRDSNGSLTTTSTSTNEFTSTSDSSGNLILSLTGTSESTSINDSLGDLLLDSSSNFSSTIIADSAGQLILSSAYSTSASLSVDSTGQLVTTGLTEFEYSIAGATIFTANSFGNIQVSGSSTVESTVSAASAGQMVTTGLSEFEYSIVQPNTFTETSSGDLQVSGSSTSAFTVNKTSSGQLKTTGSSIAEYKRNGPATFTATSAGNLQVSGTSVIESTVKSTTQPIRGGGGYVYATSWDILTPYFKDDRHILGYRDLETSGPGELGILGNSSIEFIPAPVLEVDVLNNVKGLADYIKEIESAKTAKQKQVKTKPKKAKAAGNLEKQIMLEDLMLLNGYLTDPDPIQEELDSELL